MKTAPTGQLDLLSWTAPAAGPEPADENGLTADTPRRDRPLSFDYHVDLDEVITAAHELDLRAEPPNSKGGREAFAKMIVHSAMEMRRQQRPISYSRARSHYPGQQRYHGDCYTLSNVTSAVEAMVRSGAVDEHFRAPQNGSPGVQSWYRPVEALAELSLQKRRHRSREVVRLRDATGSMVGYRDTERTIRLRRKLEAINEVLDAAEITLPDAGWVDRHGLLRIGPQTLDPAAQRLYAVFNGGWSAGGRFYGLWCQNLSKRHRLALRVDGEPAVEADYRRCHARLLYGVAGREMDGDPYLIGDWPEAISKVAFQIAINAADRRQELAAVANKLTGGDFAAAGRLCREIRERHEPVAHLLGTGIGLRLQNLDATMALVVLDRLTIRRGLPVLPVHDSFLVRERDEGHLMEAMLEAMARVSLVADPAWISRSYLTNVLHYGSGGRRGGSDVPSSLARPRSSRPYFAWRLASSPPALADPWGLDLLGEPAIVVEYPRIIGRWVWSAVERSGLSQREIAARVGVHQPHISNVAHGRDRPSRDMLRRLRRAIDEAG